MAFPVRPMPALQWISTGFKLLVSTPNLFKLAVRERGVLVVTNGDVLNLKSILPVVRNQTHLKLCVES